MTDSLLAEPLELPRAEADGGPCQLLVSVRDAAEAALVHRLGVRWIDLKDPDSGSLGAASPAVAQAVCQVLQSAEAARRGAPLAPPPAGHSPAGHSPENHLPPSLAHALWPLVTSAAAGELQLTPHAVAQQLAGYFPLIKVGLAGMATEPQWRESWEELARQVHGKGAATVAVIYADGAACDAPTPLQVMQAIDALQSTSGGSLLAPFVLIDTYFKNGRGLFDWLTLAQLSQIAHWAAQRGKRLVLAGSLSAADRPGWQALRPAGIAALAVRGAVCAGDRRGRLCPDKVHQWLQRVQST